MKLLPVVLALGILPMFAADHNAPIRLYYEFRQEPQSAVLAPIQKELDKIMQPAGLSFEWLALPAQVGDGASVEVAIIHFNGRCEVGGPQYERRAPGPLGWTLITDGQILPFIEIDCEQLQSFLLPDLLRLQGHFRTIAFGTAVARVLAHELYHMLLKTTAHSSSGVASARFTAQQLLTDALHFNRKQCEKLRAYGDYLAAMISDPGTAGDR